MAAQSDGSGPLHEPLSLLPPAAADAAQELDAINQRFYEHHAPSFSRTRQRPWPGWSRVLELYLERPRPDDPREVTARHRILDVACGNARFSDLLEAGPVPRGRPEAEITWSYWGLERSLPLLLAARQRLEAGLREHRLIRGDALQVPLAEADNTLRDSAAGHGFDLVIAFGLMHHVFSSTVRSELARRLAALTSAGGVCALSFWQFHRVPGIVERAVDPDRLVAQRRLRAGTRAQLEPGDHLLRWGDADEECAPVRYCHSASDQEVDDLNRAVFPSADFEPVVSFRADGRTAALNRYLIARRRP